MYQPEASQMRPPASLLERLRQPGDRAAWDRFVALYTPLIYSWGKRVGLQHQDAADLVQEVFVTLVQTLPSFSYDHHKSFRAWLRTVTLNKWRQRCRRAALPLAADEHALAEVATPDGTEAFEEEEYRRHLVGQALQVMQDTERALVELAEGHVALVLLAVEIGDAARIVAVEIEQLGQRVGIEHQRHSSLM